MLKPLHVPVIPMFSNSRPSFSQFDSSRQHMATNRFGSSPRGSVTTPCCMSLPLAGGAPLSPANRPYPIKPSPSPSRLHRDPAKRKQAALVSFFHVGDAAAWLKCGISCSDATHKHSTLVFYGVKPTGRDVRPLRGVLLAPVVRRPVFFQNGGGKNCLVVNHSSS